MRKEMFDEACNKAANFILVVVIAIMLYMVCHKQIEGRYMMYEDYYNSHTK